jgi:AcrR family transcriptional regulator
MAEARRPGRPRSESARQAVIAATTDLVLELGFDALTYEAIAERAGVSRQTIYRWWPRKSSIIAEAVLSNVLVIFETPAPDSDLRAVLTEWVDAMRVPEKASLVRALTAAAAADPQESDRLYEHDTRAGHEAFVAAVRKAQRDGWVRPDLDADVAADTLIGAVLSRILSRVAIPPDYVETLLRPLRLP